MERLAVFGYGSLAGPDSASRTLGRPAVISEPVRLRGWRRRWSQCRDNLLCEKTFRRRDTKELFPHVLGLNVEPDHAGEAEAPNGVLIEVSPAELELLDRRELRYDRVEVTGSIAGEGGVGFDHVFAYTAKPRHLAPQPPRRAVVLATYLAAIERSFSRISSQALEEFRRSTEPPPVEVVEPELVRDAIPAGNPRHW